MKCITETRDISGEYAVSKLIVQGFLTTARVHDAKMIDQYLGRAKSCKKVLLFADSGYTGKKISEKLLDATMPPNICFKGRAFRRKHD